MQFLANYSHQQISHMRNKYLVIKKSNFESEEWMNILKLNTVNSVAVINYFCMLFTRLMLFILFIVPKITKNHHWTLVVHLWSL